MFEIACRICKTFAANKELVKPGGSECFPSTVQSILERKFPVICEDLPRANSKRIKSAFVVKSNGPLKPKVEWFAMAFSSVNIKKIFVKHGSWCLNLDFHAAIYCIIFRQLGSCPAIAHKKLITKNGRNN